MNKQQLLEADLRAGLWKEPATLPPRWFYDEYGSHLFDQITRLPEYYQTRAEAAILSDCAAELFKICEPRTVIELGSGTSTKTRIILDVWHTSHIGEKQFVPVDVSEEVTHDAAVHLAESYPDMQVSPLITDFHHLPNPLPGVPGSRLLLFLGGTIGNFSEIERTRFLGRLSQRLDTGDHLLIGYDLVKDPHRLHSAYADPAGVTAQFNLNVLDVIASTVPAGGLDRRDFRHEARWNHDKRRIEMHLVALHPVTITFSSLGKQRSFAAGESIMTEISRKFALDELDADATAAAFTHQRTWTDNNDDFALGLYRR